MIFFNAPSLLNFEQRSGFLEQWQQKTGQNVTCRTIVLFDVCSGYHHFHNRPLIGNAMLNTLEREPDNRFDRYAVKLIAPSLNLIAPNVRDSVTRERDGQRARDIAGKCIGRLPRHLSKLISCGLDRGEITDAVAMFTGHIVHNRGPQLSMAYFFTFCDEETADTLEDELVKFPPIIRDVYLSGLL